MNNIWILNKKHISLEHFYLPFYKALPTNSFYKLLHSGHWHILQ
jgi:hypothetical protein